MLLSEATVRSPTAAQKPSEAARTMETIDIALRRLLELNDKPLLLKTSHAQDAEHRERLVASIHRGRGAAQAPGLRTHHQPYPAWTLQC